MPGQRLFLPKLVTFLLLLLFLFVSGNLLAKEAAAEPQDNADSSSSVHATLSAMDMNQVRFETADQSVQLMTDCNIETTAKEIKTKAVDP